MDGAGAGCLVDHREAGSRTAGIEARTMGTTRMPRGYRELTSAASDGRCAGLELLGQVNQKDVSRRFDGYTDKKATGKKLVCDVVKEGDMWFRTGDLLRRDEEGFIYFVDRIGDTFRWKGENVSTNEVAETVSSVPCVAECNGT